MVGVDVKQLLRRLDARATRALESAAGLCVSRGHYEVTVDPVLQKLLEEPGGDVERVLHHFEVEPARLQRAAARAVEGLPTGNTGKPVFSPILLAWLEEAFLVASVELGLTKVRTGVLLLVLLATPGRSGTEDHTDELEKIRTDELRRHFFEIVAGSDEEEPTGTPGEGAARPAARGEEESLARFTIDFTERAREGAIDPVLGRDHEIRQLTDVLTRRRKNNPMLVGEAGVGKTAVVEGFALRVAQGDVPAPLRDVRVLGLDLGLLQAGAGVRGEFENRLKGVIEEVRGASVPTILFIDEAHTMIGAGGPSGGSDAANLLKPPLARGELRTIGATTWGEFKKYIEKDPALERRFQPVKVDEPSVENATVMLRGVREKFEAHHGVRVLDRAVEAAVRLSDRYIAGRQLPDKAVDLLDTACARVAMGQSAKPAALDDLERRLEHASSAIAALERDAEEALVDGERDLAALRSEREELERRRAELSERWERERSRVEAIRGLQSALVEARGEEPAAADSAAAGARADERGGGAGDAPPEPRGEPAALRAEIEKAVAELEALQGESPLVQLHVDVSAIAEVVGDWTGIPVGNMLRDDLERILSLEESLRERVVGQDHAIAAVARKIRAAKSGLQPPSQPIGVFLLVGPSGVGKTETGLALADLLFGGERFMVTVNMSEFMEKHSVSRLIGSPPGYVGFGEGGVLTEAVRHRPYSVVLLDEIEKADPEVMNLFYQVFDKGTLADGEGRVVDFRNTVVLMTSNLASDRVMEACGGDELPDDEALVERIRPVLQQHLKPALLGRMSVVPYYPLGESMMRRITRMKLERVGERLAERHGIAFEVDDAARDALARRCTDAESGARNADHVIDRTVLPRVSQRLLEEMASEALPARLRLELDEEGELALAVERS